MFQFFVHKNLPPPRPLRGGGIFCRLSLFKFYRYNLSYKLLFSLGRNCIKFEFTWFSVGLCIGPESFRPPLFLTSFTTFPLSFDPTFSFRKEATFRKEMLVWSEGINTRRGPKADQKPAGQGGTGPTGPIRAGRTKASRADRPPGWAKRTPAETQGAGKRQGPATRARWLFLDPGQRPRRPHRGQKRGLRAKRVDRFFYGPRS